jgi:hypothetical protein
MRLTPEQIILSHGFNKAGTCMCGGIMTKKYKKGRTMIYVRPGKEQFKVKYRRETIHEFQPVANLETILNELDVAV